jgi:hypothetical protein
MPTPTIGQPLPRAAEAWAAPAKWRDWILADRGHGQEWARVLRIGLEDSERLWRAIAVGILRTPVSGIRDLGPRGVNCQVRLLLMLDDRFARTLTIWNYESPSHVPRLVTAYPTT